ncbi:hypothetical protein Vadar_025987 [Vaccinium darrowii]|uniref:Uncharacterized protein n=1 Tax=Vaccinium darrowii TaxID=229202 RepID=A0ACB7XT17_9ERIC|nr:hypothetical protein Vadar_025987 [Vaccinium darrowii]
MAAKQMEEIQKKLAMLNYPRANAPAQSLLFAGMERYALLEWLFLKLLGDKSPFSQQNLQGDGMDRDEETAPFSIGFLLYNLPGCCCSSSPQVLMSRPAISDLEKQLADQSNRFLNLQEMVDDLASKHAYNPDEDYTEVEAKLRGHLESFLETARSFNTIYTKEIRPWTHMMEVPQLHGFGPASNHLLEAYKMLLKFLGNLRNLRDAHAAVAVGSSETIAGEPSSIARIISECESASTFLNRDLGILSASIAREQGEEVNL